MVSDGGCGYASWHGAIRRGFAADQGRGWSRLRSIVIFVRSCRADKRALQTPAIFGGYRVTLIALSVETEMMAIAIAKAERAAIIGAMPA